MHKTLHKQLSILKTDFVGHPDLDSLSNQDILQKFIDLSEECFRLTHSASEEQITRLEFAKDLLYSKKSFDVLEDDAMFFIVEN